MDLKYKMDSRIQLLLQKMQHREFEVLYYLFDRKLQVQVEHFGKVEQ